VSSTHVAIVSVGEEIVTGQTPDTNARFLAWQLMQHGFRVRRIVAVGDDPEVVKSELRSASADCELIVLTGGLGPTADDRTRGAIAEVAGTRLVLDADSAEHVRRIVQAHGRDVSEGHLRQAYFPAGSEVFPNPRGTARGFACSVGGSTLIAMPGVPAEMRAVFRGGVLPYLLAQHRERTVVATVNLFGLPESEVDSKLEDLMGAERNPQVGLKVEEGVVSVCLRATAASVRQARALIERDVQTVCERFGDAVFGRDETTLAQALSELLEAQEHIPLLPGGRRGLQQQVEGFAVGCAGR